MEARAEWRCERACTKRDNQFAAFIHYSPDRPLCAITPRTADSRIFSGRQFQGVDRSSNEIYDWLELAEGRHVRLTRYDPVADIQLPKADIRRLTRLLCRLALGLM